MPQLGVLVPSLHTWALGDSVYQINPFLTLQSPQDCQIWVYPNMAEVTRTDVLPQATKSVESRETLQRCLDNLLEQYLNLLDQYQKLQQDLTKNLSDGYLSLAKANFSNTNRNHYGQDFYDDRMQASTRVSLGHSRPFFFTATPTRLGLQPMSGVDETGSQKPPERDETTIASGKGKGPPVSPNPLNWFGILVPQALRAAQSNFQGAVTRNVPELASITKEMKEVEIEVRRTRKKLRKAV